MLIAAGKNITIGNDTKGKYFKYFMYFPNTDPWMFPDILGFKEILK